MEISFSIPPREQDRLRGDHLRAGVQRANRAAAPPAHAHGDHLRGLRAVRGALRLQAAPGRQRLLPAHARVAQRLGGGRRLRRGLGGEGQRRGMRIVWTFFTGTDCPSRHVFFYVKFLTH